MLRVPEESTPPDVRIEVVVEDLCVSSNPPILGQGHESPPADPRIAGQQEEKVPEEVGGLVQGGLRCPGRMDLCVWVAQGVIEFEVE